MINYLFNSWTDTSHCFIRLWRHN